MKQALLIFASIVCFATITLSCKKNSKNEPDPIQSPEPIKSATFKIHGNFTGSIFVVYNDNVSGNTTVTVSSYPWTKTIDYPDNVQAIGIAGQITSGSSGVAGQILNLEIIHNGTLVKSSTGTADVNGTINLPPLAYLFP